MVSIPWIPALKNQLDASEHLARAPGIFDLAAFDFDFDPKVAFDSGNGVYHDFVCHIFLSFYLADKVIVFVRRSFKKSVVKKPSGRFVKR
jgi:hypothetical protein